MNKIILVIILILIILGAIFFWKYPEFLSPVINSVNNNANNGIVAQNKTLDLSNKGLEKIPDYVFNQTNLEELDVSDNKLTDAIQSQIGQLYNLKILNASNNLMTGVPAEVGQLQKLEILDLSNNRLTGLPNELGNLINLKTLNLSGNQYSQQDLNYIRVKLPSTTQIIL